MTDIAALGEPNRSVFFRPQASPGNQLTALATKLAHLLRLARHPQAQPCFMKNRRLSTCGFLFALFAVVEGSSSNVVDGPVSWQVSYVDALAR